MAWYDFDTNGDGTPDIKQGWFWLSILKVAAKAAVTFAAPHTIAARAGNEVLKGTAIIEGKP